MADKGLEDIEAGESSLRLCCDLVVRMRRAAGERFGAATKFAKIACTDHVARYSSDRVELR